MKASADELYRSMDGIVTNLQRELLAEVLRVIQEQTEQVKRVDQLIEMHMDLAYAQAAVAIDALPGIAQLSAQFNACQCAVVAVNNKASFFHAQYQRPVVRRGKKRAIVAVAHSMLIAIYHVLSGSNFTDLGVDYYNQFNTQKKINVYLIKLKNLGWSPPASVVPA